MMGYAEGPIIKVEIDDTEDQIIKMERPAADDYSHVLIAHISAEAFRGDLLMALEELGFVAADSIPEATSLPSGDRPSRTFASFRSGVVPDRRSLLLAVVESDPTTADRDHWAEIVEAAWAGPVEVLSIIVGGARMPAAFRRWPAVNVDADTHQHQLAALLRERLGPAQAAPETPAQDRSASGLELGTRLALIAQAADALAAESLR